jgi:hypothetical protein
MQNRSPVLHIDAEEAGVPLIMIVSAGDGASGFREKTVFSSSNEGAG